MVRTTTTRSTQTSDARGRSRARATPRTPKGSSLLLLLVGLVSSCQSQRPRAPTVAAQGSEVVPSVGVRTELSSLIPAPGVVYLLQLRPARLMADHQLRKDWEAVFESERLSSVERATGLEFDVIDELWWVGYPLGTLMLVDARKVGTAAEEAFVARASSVSSAEVDDAGGTWITGVVDEEPRALYHRAGDFLAIAYQDVGLAKIVRGYAQGRVRAKTALDTRFLAPLAQVEGQAPLRAWLVGPFDGAANPVVQGFAAGALAVAPRTQHLEVTLRARGLWPEAVDTALSSWLVDFLDTREARALGLGFPATRPTIQCTHESAPQPGTASSDPQPGTGSMELSQCTAQLLYHSAQLAQAVHRLTQAPTEDLLSDDSPGSWRSQIIGPAEETPQP